MNLDVGAIIHYALKRHSRLDKGVMNYCSYILLYAYPHRKRHFFSLCLTLLLQCKYIRLFSFKLFIPLKKA